MFTSVELNFMERLINLRYENFGSDQKLKTTHKFAFLVKKCVRACVCVCYLG